MQKKLAASIKQLFAVETATATTDVAVNREERPDDRQPIDPVDHPNNLPAQTTRLIGREKEVAEVLALLRREDIRLVTLSGPGGTGKTRLGLQVATELTAEFNDGVFFVNLAPITDPGLVVSTIAQALSVQEIGGQPIIDGLKSFLKSRHVLLLLDNLEQIVSAAPAIALLLVECPGLRAHAKIT